MGCMIFGIKYATPEMVQELAVSIHNYSFGDADAPDLHEQVELIVALEGYVDPDYINEQLLIFAYVIVADYSDRSLHVFRQNIIHL